MKIEVDTQRDSREELAHLANMLKAIAGTSSVSRDVSVHKQSNIFEDSSPSLGVFNMFGDSSSQPAQQPKPGQQAQQYGSEYSQPSSSQSSSSPAQSGGADIFSLFGSSPAGSSADSTSVDAAQPNQEIVPHKGSSVRELLDDERIVPY